MRAWLINLRICVPSVTPQEDISNQGKKRMSVVTWQEAEDTLTAAIEYLGAMDDRERGFLAAGSRSCWPAIIREVDKFEYVHGADPSPQLTRRNCDLVELVLTGERPLANCIPEGHRVLVGRVIVMQRWPGDEGFGWDLVWRRMGGELFNIARQRIVPTTSDGMRKAYSRAIRRLAMALGPHQRMVV